MRKGFTLIELLIVVAIIAILAAIAVPNFLEAQTRAKVARSRADLRTLAVGIESYVVDHGKSPQDGDDGTRTNVARELDRTTDIFPVCTPGEGINNMIGRTYQFRSYTAWHAITTPVSYVTSIYIEPYSSFVPYAHYDESSSVGDPSYQMLTSCGPDKTISYDAGQAFMGQTTDSSNGYGGRLISGVPGGPSGLERSMNNVYDPTNGTISWGEVYRLCAVKNIDNFYSMSTNNENGHGYGFPLNN